MRTIERHLVGYLKDAHALQEHVGATLSELLTTVAAEPDACRPLGRFAETTRLHTREIEARLRAHGSAPSMSGTRGSCSRPSRRPASAAAAATPPASTCGTPTPSGNTPFGN